MLVYQFHDHRYQFLTQQVHVNLYKLFPFDKTMTILLITNREI